MATRETKRVKVKRAAHKVSRWLAGATQPRYGYDCVSAYEIYDAGVRNPSWVAGYVDGPFEWTQAQWDLFPESVHVYIATQAYVNAGDVLDVENGDATPTDTEAWIRMRKAAGYYRPTIYTSEYNIPAVRVGTGPYVLGVDYDIWVADWTNVPHQVDGNVATQYENVSWADFDVAYDPDWPHRVAPAPAPKVAVPNVAGLDYTKAKAALSKAGFKITIKVRYTDTVITSQSPVAGAKAAKGSVVTVVGKNTTPPSTAEPQLQYGNTGAAVETLQTDLNKVDDAKLTVDGNFGPKTLAAVKAFQKAKKLTVDGIVGPKTWSALTDGKDTLVALERIPNRHVATGSVSLDAAAAWRGFTPSEVVAYSMSHLTTANQAKLVAYLGEGNGPANVMPKGLVYWTPPK